MLATRGHPAASAGTWSPGGPIPATSGPDAPDTTGTPPTMVFPLGNQGGFFLRRLPETGFGSLFFPATPRSQPSLRVPGPQPVPLLEEESPADSRFSWTSPSEHGLRPFLPSSDRPCSLPPTPQALCLWSALVSSAFLRISQSEGSLRGVCLEFRLLNLT